MLVQFQFTYILGWIWVFNLNQVQPGPEKIIFSNQNLTKTGIDSNKKMLI